MNHSSLFIVICRDIVHVSAKLIDVVKVIKLLFLTLVLNGLVRYVTQEKKNLFKLFLI